jgi:hypothetical protein
VRSESAKLGDTLEPDPKLAEEIKRDSAAILCPANSRLGRNFSAWFGILVRTASRSFSRRPVPCAVGEALVHLLRRCAETDEHFPPTCATAELCSLAVTESVPRVPLAPAKILPVRVILV